ncbi:MAG: T9SS type A sorting domain-containing protein [Flavobacteriales bacterium]|nr:T9SS type A sorting domain-containing protein [Flavobacteriales bacterium]
MLVLDFVLGQLNANCNCVGLQCTTDLTLDITMPAFGTLPTWELREDATDILVQNGGGGFANPGVNQQNTCLPEGNFRLIMNGVPTGGSYVLRTSGNPGTRIIDNITTTAGTTSVTAFSTTPAALSSNGAVQVPVGQTDLLFTNCDKPFWKSGEYVVCNEDAQVAAAWVLNGANTVQSATTGYDFWFYDPNGGYSYIRQRRHNVSDNFANVGSSRTCHMKVNNWATANHIPDGVKLNVRVRAVVNNIPANWGPACRFVRDEALAACPPTKLFDLQGFPQFYSCNVTRAFISNASNRLYARPVSGANKYKFTITSAELATPIVKVVNTYYLTLGWTSGPTMNVGETYDVTVQASFNNGASYCVVGDACSVSIISNAVVGQQSIVLDGQRSELNMWPNPNNGDVLNMSLRVADPFISTVNMDIFDLSGKRMIARTIGIQDGVLNTTIDLNGDVAVGMYMVKIIAGEELFTQRVVIQK